MPKRSLKNIGGAVTTVRELQDGVKAYFGFGLKRTVRELQESVRDLQEKVAENEAKILRLETEVTDPRFRDRMNEK